jgi:hypothetical protein
MVTTIQLDRKTRDKLRDLKIHPRESYDDVVNRLLAMRNEEGELSDATIRQIESSLRDIKAGRTLSMNELKRQMNIK